MLIVKILTVMARALAFFHLWGDTIGTVLPEGGNVKPLTHVSVK
jgi:hypothetical protein